MSTNKINSNCPFKKKEIKKKRNSLKIMIEKHFNSEFKFSCIINEA